MLLGCHVDTMLINMYNASRAKVMAAPRAKVKAISHNVMQAYLLLDIISVSLQTTEC